VDFHNYQLTEDKMRVESDVWAKILPLAIRKEYNELN
jgi:hypothetical protein